MKAEAARTVRTLEQLAAKRARDKALSARWNVNIVILSYTVLATILLLRFEGVAIEIVSPVAIFGLAMIWLAGWMRGKKLYKQFYEQELYKLQEEGSQGEEGEISSDSPLSLRETEILSRVASGCINKQIATELGISEQTIKNHITHILEKLDVGDRTHAVVIAMQQGWVLPSGITRRVNGKSGRNLSARHLKRDVSSLTMVR